MIRTRLAVTGVIFSCLILTMAALAVNPALNGVVDGTWVSLSSMPEGSIPDVVVVESNGNGTVVRLDVPGYYSEEIEADGVTYQIPRIPDAGMMTGVGDPELPVITRWVAVPDQGEVICEVLSQTVTQIPGVPVYPLQDVDEEYYPQQSIYRNQALYARDDVYPESPVTISEPMVMRDYRVVAVSWMPLRTSPSQGGITATTSIEVEIRATSDPGTNEKVRTDRRITPSFYNIYRSNLINFDQLYDEGTPQPGSVLIICPDNSQVTSRLTNLINWKKRKGYTVTLATTTQTGTSFTSIKSYIQTAYNTWNPPLEFVILVGDAEGTYSIATHSTYFDHGYAQLDGTDIIADVPIGRLSFDDTNQLTNLVNKIVGYESNPYMTQTAWYNRAYFLAGTLHAYSPLMVKRYIRDQLLEAGIQNVTVRDYSSSTIPATEMRSNVNAGVLYFNYRGSWISEMLCSHFQGQLTNGYMLPAAVVITCGTGTFNSTYEESVSECWLREGTLSTPAGAIGCIGTATSGTHTRQNNIMDTGVFYGLFAKHLYNFGAALVEAKIQLVNAFPFDQSSQTSFSYWNNLMGDPSVECWTGVPQLMSALYPAQIPLGQNFVSLTVRDASSNPIPDALVCLLKEGQTFLTDYTDNAGALTLPITVTTTGVLKLTVTKHDYKPILADINVVNGDIIALDSMIIDDDNVGSSHGNNNGVANPGETVELSVRLKNWGTSQASSVSAVLEETDSYVTVYQDSASYGNIAAGGTTWSSIDYILSIAGNCPDQHVTNMFIMATPSGGSTYTSMVPIVVRSANLEFDHRTLIGVGGDAQFDPGESGSIVLYLNNGGGFPATSVQGNMTSSHPLAVVTNPLGSFGSIAGGGSGNNSGSPFTVQMSGVIFPGQPVTFTVALSGTGGFADTVQFLETVGNPTALDPTGPDQHGYWAFENTDTLYLKHPTYHWVEIDPNYGGTGTLIPLTDYSENQDDSEVLTLPFQFFYYGGHYTRITVCSNGWLAFGEHGDIIDFRNYCIPGGDGPSAMVAAFWDDLVLSSGHVYWSHDALLHRYTVEWSNVRTRYNNYLETFQVVLYDPAMYTTPTGDGEILFLYQTVNNVIGDYDDIPYATVGIESPDQLDGIQYTYWNAYPSSASGLSAGRAILFTTESGSQGMPVDTVGPEISHVALGNTIDPIGPYEVNAEVWDHSGIDLVDIHYATNQLNFVTDPMTNLGGQDWQYLIPGQAPGTAVCYFLSATDDSGNYSQTDTFAFNVWDVVARYDFESGASGWTHYSNSVGFQDQWALSYEDSYSPVTSWKCGDTGTGQYAILLDACLQSPGIQLPTNAELHFFHRIESEISISYPDSAYDGGNLEISCDGGPWEQLMSGCNYNRRIRSVSANGNPYSGPFNSGTRCWAGTINWTEVTVSLAGHQGSCRIRFRFGSDDETSMEGWYIDDVVIIGLPEGALPVPEGLTISKSGNHIYLNWDAVFGATRYTIYHATEPEPATWDSLSTVFEPMHSFQHLNAVDFRIGYYRVVAGN